MRIVFFDIDGTLALGTWVPDSAREAIRILRENGDLVFICSGRNVSYVRKHFSAYADGFITNNGRLAYLGDEMILERPIDKEIWQRMVSILESHHAGYVFHSRNRGYYGGPDELFNLIGDPVYVTKGLKEEERYYNADICFYDEEQLQEIAKALKDLCIVNPHGPHHSADLSVLGFDKGDAIKAVAETLNADLSDTYAFGDGLNDITMLKAAGHGIAMGNAFQETRDAAEFVTGDINEDGVKSALKHYGLID